MRTIKDLYKQLNEESDFEKKYPTYQENDGKIHILYIAPCLNGTGVYRMILPMLELNKTTTHTALLTTIHKWSFAKQFDDYDNPIDRRLIQWADYVVLPALFSDVNYIVKPLEQINNNLQFVMDLDCNYHKMPKEHPDYKKYTPEHLQQLLDNIAEMDILTGASEGLLASYENLINQRTPEAQVMLVYLPNLISNYGFQELAAIKQNTSDKLKIGLIGNYSKHYDLLSIKKVLIESKEKYKDQVEFVFFGWNGRLASGEQALKDLTFTFEKSVSFLDYYEKLNDLQLDLVLLPSTAIPYNTKGTSIIKYLELAAFAIPVIASKQSPYQDHIDDENDGLLAGSEEEWKSKIETLLSNANYRHAVGKAALRKAWRHYSYTSKNLQLFTHLFN